MKSTKESKDAGELRDREEKGRHGTGRGGDTEMVAEKKFV